MNIPERVYNRILNKAERVGGCLISGYSTGSHGYPQVGWREGRKDTVTTCHLALWRYLHGEPPEGMTVDHKCKNKLCVDATHYRLIPNFENARRTHGRDWAMGQCVNGHPNSELYVCNSEGRLRCRPCNREQQARYRARKAAGLIPARSAK